MADVPVRLTRRGFVAGASAVALAPDARADEASVRTFIGKTGAEIAPLAARRRSPTVSASPVFRSMGNRARHFMPR